MKNYINLFETLGNDGAYGLIQYLKERNDKDLRILANQYSVKRNITNKDEIIKAILYTMEKTLNIGYVFTESKRRTELVKLYR